jgi:NIMA (never in mitosis gene a)-related kinase
MERYERLKVLGQGSFGKVYLSKCKADRTLVCIKAITVKGLPKKERDACRNEVALMQKLRHPNICEYKESFMTKDGSTLSIVMQYCDGGDLAGAITGCKARRLKEAKILGWFVQICLGLHFMHENHVMHRDLKGGNIFLLSSGRLVLGDLGISKDIGSMGMAQTAIGTPYYMSPEIFENKPYSYKSDVWSLGCVLYEMAAKKPPFGGSSMAALMRQIIRGQYQPLDTQFSAPLRDLVTQMLKLDPRQRPSTADILQQPLIRQHAVAFFADIASRSSGPSAGRGGQAGVGAGTLNVQAALQQVASNRSVAGSSESVTSLRRQLESLGMKDALTQALAQQEAGGEDHDSGGGGAVAVAAAGRPGVARRVVKEQTKQLKREKERMRQAKIALDNVKQQRELLWKEHETAQGKMARLKRQQVARNDVPAQGARAREAAGRVPRVAEAPIAGRMNAHEAKDIEQAKQAEGMKDEIGRRLLAQEPTPGAEKPARRPSRERPPLKEDEKRRPSREREEGRRRRSDLSKGPTGVAGRRRDSSSSSNRSEVVVHQKPLQQIPQQRVQPMPIVPLPSPSAPVLGAAGRGGGAAGKQDVLQKFRDKEQAKAKCTDVTALRKQHVAKIHHQREQQFALQQHQNRVIDQAQGRRASAADAEAQVKAANKNVNKAAARQVKAMGVAMDEDDGLVYMYDEDAGTKEKVVWAKDGKEKMGIKDQNVDDDDGGGQWAVTRDADEALAEAQARVEAEMMRSVDRYSFLQLKIKANKAAASATADGSSPTPPQLDDDSDDDDSDDDDDDAAFYMALMRDKFA